MCIADDARLTSSRRPPPELWLRDVKPLSSSQPRERTRWPPTTAAGYASRVAGERKPKVELFAWNPEREVSKVAGGPPVLHRVHNFGDLLGPIIVREILRRRGLEGAEAVRQRRLFSVGSVMHFARDGDVIWGTGINGKADSGVYERTKLDIRAVRGPMTAAKLHNSGQLLNDTYGDPGSLVGMLWPRSKMRRSDLVRPVLVVPNFNDLPTVSTSVPLLDPRSPVKYCVQAIASTDLVIASSLHAIVVAESFGIPAIRLASSVEPDFKYDDYYSATGRAIHQRVGSVGEALAAGPTTEEPFLRLDLLLEAFPADLWQPLRSAPNAQ